MTIEPVHPRPPQHPMPFVPALKVRGAGTLLFLSGCTALPLYHSHPHVAEELTPPGDIREQTRRVLDNHRLVLEAAGASFAKNPDCLHCLLAPKCPSAALFAIKPVGKAKPKAGAPAKPKAARGRA